MKIDALKFYVIASKLLQRKSATEHSSYFYYIILIYVHIFLLLGTLISVYGADDQVNVKYQTTIMLIKIPLSRSFCLYNGSDVRRLFRKARMAEC